MISCSMPNPTGGDETSSQADSDESHTSAPATCLAPAACGPSHVCYRPHRPFHLDGHIHPLSYQCLNSHCADQELRTAHSFELLRAASADLGLPPAYELLPEQEDEVIEIEPPTGEWYHIIFHTITAFVGAGVLALPYAMSWLQWGPGLVFLVTCAFVSTHSAFLLSRMHCIDGRRFNAYLELGQHLLGPTWGFWSVIPFQYAVCFGNGIAYAITGAVSMRNIAGLLGYSCQSVRFIAWISCFSCIQSILSQMPNLHSLWVISLMGGVMSVLYTLIAALAPIIWRGEAPTPSYALRGKDPLTNVMGAMSALGNVAFAFGGHPVLLEIQATLKPANPSPHQAMRKGLSLAFTFICIGYTAISVAGYGVYGNTVADNVLASIDAPAWLLVAANAMVLLHVVASYQVYSMPLFELLELWCIDRGVMTPKNSVAFRLSLRTAVVALHGFLAALLPFFGDLMALIGAVTLTPTVFVLPSVLWLKHTRAGPATFTFWLNITIIVVFVCAGSGATVGAMFNIVKNASTYSLFN